MYPPYDLILGGPGGGFCGPGAGFGGPGGGFSGSRSSGKPLLLLRLKKPPPGLQKPVPGPPGPPRYSLLAPPGTIIDCPRVGLCLCSCSPSGVKCSHTVNVFSYDLHAPILSLTKRMRVVKTN